MDGVLLLLLGGATLGLGWLAYRARERFFNLLAGSGSRNWLLTHAPEILNDPRATPQSRAAAEYMLGAIYDERVLRKVSRRKHCAHKPKAEDFSVQRFGRHVMFVERGIRHLAVLALLSDDATGRAIRRLLHDEHWIESIDGHDARTLRDRIAALFRERVLAASSRVPQSEGGGEDFTDKFVISLTSDAPYGIQVNSALSSALLEHVSDAKAH